MARKAFTLNLSEISKRNPAGLPSLGAVDSQNNVFFARELEHIIPALFETEFARNSARELFPIDRSAGPHAKTITYRQFTQVGSAKIVSDYANDLPLSDVFGEEFTGNVRTLVSVARWSIDEILAAVAVSRPLGEMKSKSARDNILRLENQIAFAGDATHGLVGLFSDPNIPTATVVDPGSGTEWVNKTGTEMFDDMCTCVNAIPENTQDIERARRLLIATNQYNLAKCTRMETGTDTTALQFFINNFPEVEVVSVRELTGAGTAGVDVMVAYDPDPSKLQMNITMELEQLPPQERDMTVKVIYRSKFGGLTVFKPLSLNICEGI